MTPSPADTPHTRRYALPPPPRRWMEGPARRTGTPSPRSPDRGPTLRAWVLHCRSERLSEFHQSRPDSCPHGSARLIQPCRDLVIRQLGKERGLDDFTLFRFENCQGVSQEATLFLEIAGLVGITRGSHRQGGVRPRVDAIFSVVEKHSHA